MASVLVYGTTLASRGEAAAHGVDSLQTHFVWLRLGPVEPVTAPQCECGSVFCDLGLWQQVESPGAASQASSPRPLSQDARGPRSVRFLGS